MAAADDLYQIAAEFLAVSVDALDAHTTLGAPERQYVSHNQPALDCEQITVHTSLLGEADLAAGPGALARAHAINRGGLPLVTLSVTNVRCVPTLIESGGEVFAPPASELDASARTLNEDVWVLWLGITESLKHGTLAQICSGAERLGAVPLGPEGGFGGWVLTYRYPIPGGILGT